MDFLRTCISFGLNARQISDLSLSTPQPLRAVQSVYDLIESQNLARLYKSRRVANRRKGDHNQNLIGVFAKLVGQAYEYGYEVRELFRDEAPAPRMKFRPDLGLKVGDRQFYVEVQLSKIQMTRWHERMRNYVKLYKLLRRPFRVLFLIDRSQDVPKLREYAREVLAENPDLNLFYFLQLAEFQKLSDVLCARVWHVARHPKERASLMDRRDAGGGRGADVDWGRCSAQEATPQC